MFVPAEAARNSKNVTVAEPVSSVSAREKGSPQQLDPALGPFPEPIRSDPNPGLARLALHWVYDWAWLIVIVVTAIYWIPRWIFDRGFAHMAKTRLGFCWPDLRKAGPQKRILVHGVSVGEVKGAQSLIRGLRERYTDYEIVVSTTTNTGESVARDLYPDLKVVRFPVDISWIVSRFLQRIAPTVVVLIELEIWPNFLRQSNLLGAPLCVVNGRITERSFRAYRLFRNLMPQFNRITLFSAQNEEYAERFSRLVGTRGAHLSLWKYQSRWSGDTPRATCARVGTRAGGQRRTPSACRRLDALS